MSETIDFAKWQIAQQLSQMMNDLRPEKGEVSFTPGDLFAIIERPKESSLGDYACPCFRFAKILGKNPQLIASSLAETINQSSDTWIEGAEAAGAFLNLRVNLPTLAQFLLEDIQAGSFFKRLEGRRDRVMIEYSQPNTHKVFHVGHMRNVALGDSLGRLYKYCGYSVVMANYIGDEGAHIAKCLWYIKKHGLTVPAAHKGEWLGDIYAKSCIEIEDANDEQKIKYNQEVSEVLKEIESKQGETFDFWQSSRQWSIDDFKEIYQWVGAQFDHWFYESEVSHESQAIVDEFLGKGVFIEDDGAVGLDLKSEKCGFVLLRKRDGNTLYATKDLALARRKFDEFEIQKCIYVVASEQNLHFKQVFRTLEKMGFSQAKDCYHLSYGMVVLPDGKMSSRKGNVITFDKLRKTLTSEMDKNLAKYRGQWSDQTIAETNHKLCVGAIRYGMICSDPAKDIVFDLKDWISFEGNTGPYLMYAYARTQSILSKAKEQGLSAGGQEYQCLSHDDERDLLRFINDFNATVLLACETNRISTLAHFLFNMCKCYNRLLSNVSILKGESQPIKETRLALLTAFSAILKTGLDILGIDTTERM